MCIDLVVGHLLLYVCTNSTNSLCLIPNVSLPAGCSYECRMHLDKSSFQSFQFKDRTGLNCLFSSRYRSQARPVTVAEPLLSGTNHISSPERREGRIIWSQGVRDVRERDHIWSSKPRQEQPTFQDSFRICLIEWLCLWQGSGQRRDQSSCTPLRVSTAGASLTVRAWNG